MKTQNIKYIVVAFIVTCFVGATIVGPTQAATPRPKSGRDAAATTNSSNGTNPGRLIIRRIPNLGNNVIVDLYIDSVATSAITYGQTYEAVLTPGRHVLSVLATPSPKWPDPSDLILNVRRGETYSFTAMGDGAGRLILKGS